MIKSIDNDSIPLFISFSGGETSGYMLHHLLKEHSGKRDIHVLFANTGQENEETLVFVKNCADYFKVDIVWIEAEISMKYGVGVVFERMISKLGIPNIENLYCTRDLKERPMQHYLKSIGVNEYHTAIGIRADEIDRIGKHYYPLVPLGITKQHINFFWNKMPFRLQLNGYQGNCKWCYKKSLRKHLTLLNQNPEYYDFPNRMEVMYGDFVNPNRLGLLKKQGKELNLPIHFFRDNLSANEMMVMAVGFTDFAKDDSLDINFQTSLIDGLELDTTNGCVESCEIF